MQKRSNAHILESLERDMPRISEKSEDMSEVVDEFLHELENVSPENSCERKALNMADCMLAFVNMIKWLIGFIVWENHRDKNTSKLKHE